MKTALSLSTLSLLMTLNTVSAEPMALDAPPQRISMFKNGLAMVTSAAELKRDGDYSLTAPEARYGSFWIGWGDGLSLETIKVNEVDGAEEADVTNLIDLLRANVGKQMSIRLHDEEAWASGTLLSMPVRPQPTPQPYTHGGYPVMPATSDLMLFETEEGTLAMMPSRVAQVRFAQEQISTKVENPKMETALSFSAKQADGKGRNVVMRYLAQGIAWSPSYVVEMIDDETAKLACKAVIVNDLMDLDGVDVELIAGYPNLQYAKSPSAMSATPLDALLNSLENPNQLQYVSVMSNAMVTAQSARYEGGYGGGYGGSASYTANIPDLPSGEGAEDLYFYQLPNVTLAKGERGYYPLISATVPGGHVYTWDIADFVDANDRYQHSSQQQERKQEQIVWHSLELTNTTDKPWTTAPGMAVKDGRVLGQDTLHFTPPGGTSLLKITQALSIDAEQNEVEVERERNAINFHGNTYDKVTVTGTLTVTNYKDKTVTVKINKLVSGEVVSADANPEVVKIASGMNRVNPRSKLTWETEIEPGKDKMVTIKYQYSFYTR